MESQYGILLVIVVVLIGVFIAITTRMAKARHASVDWERQAEHDEQTRLMTQRLADTGTQWQIAQNEASGESDSDDPADQSIEAQFGR